MNVMIIANGQKLRLDASQSRYIEGSQQFVRFVFDLSPEWDGLTVFAQFNQNGTGYNSYLDDQNAVYLPHEIVKGICSLTLCGTGGDVIATTDALKLIIDDNFLIEDAESTVITLSLYQQLVNRVNGFEDDVNDSIDDFESSVNTTVSGLRGDVTQLSSEVSQLDTEVTQFGTEISQFDAEITQFRSDISTVLEDVSDLSDEVDLLTTQIDGLSFWVDATGHLNVTFNDGNQSGADNNDNQSEENSEDNNTEENAGE